MRNKIKWHIIRETLAIISIMNLCGCNHEEGYHAMRGSVWGTTYNINYKGAANLEDSVTNTLEEVGKSLSVFDAESLVNKVNHGNDTEVDHHFKTVYNISVKVNRLSDGAFDPTLAPLIRAWGFGERNEERIPATTDSLRSIIGIDKTRLAKNRLIKENPGIEFNFSAIAKGYGCDAIADMFRRNGVNDFIIEIGGEVTVRGKSPRGQAWRIGIESPDNYRHPESAPEFAGFITLKNESVATSSNLRNTRKPISGEVMSPPPGPRPGKHKQGEGTVGHIFSGRSLEPIASDVLSATIIAGRCAEADALATAAVASGAESARKFLEKAKIKAMLITADSTYYINWK